MILNHVDNGFGCGCGWQQQNPHKGWRHMDSRPKLHFLLHKEKQKYRK